MGDDYFIRRTRLIVGRCRNRFRIDQHRDRALRNDYGSVGTLFMEQLGGSLHVRQRLAFRRSILYDDILRRAVERTEQRWIYVERLSSFRLFILDDVGRFGRIRGEHFFASIIRIGNENEIRGRRERDVGGQRGINVLEGVKTKERWNNDLCICIFW